MLEHVHTYEEATAFLDNDIDGAFDQGVDRVLKIRTVIMTAIPAFLVIGISIWLADFIIFIGLCPTILAFAMMGISSILAKKKRDYELLSGKKKVYDGLNEEQTIRLANKHIDATNKRLNY